MTVGAVDDFDTVFSAHAEVVPSGMFPRGGLFRILRARGGSSIVFPFSKQRVRYSPRTRR